ncbi:MAG TPA: DNA mismatch repair endonuclease MutL [Gemmatimonadaceae bacterium]|jgi:DNA mismatch repair protein MutL|nr:DNA mismatch repair endonuclease MutL [Gemmatimonadaceae bacterium]
MPRIAVLQSAVVDQIAAGEVVERPASVVKELVENALDAEARSIEITVEDGGRARIRVADDGIGMERDDALLAVQRHATSKIRQARDLVGVSSFGFRGEALPAIASVSEMELETAADDGAGTIIRLAGGVMREVADTSRRRGTSVTVARLFHNAPARQRFLRSARSEWRAIVEVLTQLALTRRDVRLAVVHDGRPVLSLPVAGTLRARVGALWGAERAERLLEVDDVSGEVRLVGLVERPGDVGSGGRRLFLSINGRSIRDHGLVRAAEAAYRSTIPAGARPTLILELTLPADSIDVNVHPTKAEARYRDRWAVERAVERVVRRALGGADASAALGGSYAAWRFSNGAAPREAGQEVDVEVLRQPSSGDLAGPVFSMAPYGASESPVSTGEGAGVAPPAGEAHPVRSEGGAPAEPVPQLVQLHRTYIMLEREEGLVLIDQHSAHERVLYERFMGTLESGEAPSQRLLFPITLHLGPAEGEAFDEHRSLFEQLGFEIEGFGGHTLIVSAVPMPHPRFDAQRCLRDTLDSLTGDRLAGAAAKHERLAATLACKAAIKAGDQLSEGEMRALYVALRATRLPAHDVHGRSTIVRLGWDEVERRFGRR